MKRERGRDRLEKEGGGWREIGAIRRFGEGKEGRERERGYEVWGYKIRTE